MTKSIIKVGLAIHAVLFAFVGGFVLEGDIPTLMAFLIVVLCLGFIGIVEAIEAVKKDK